eukprot:CAMPEP_0170168188 /NCGR_PEP_ID=MMETSP0040_2-20121228/1325_1 /TAXON_ID=641309 /ORGANISM="Lotharella oceanica, Strain CCMP622" /LENGTH=365 /DNA_ID=CAMNT_0010406389 /DNA_START=33 /DNA_END=1131 /DNA_ORIENTATION=+
MSRQKRNTTTPYHLVRLKFGKKTVFELMAHPGAAADFRNGKKSLQAALMVDTVFTNAKKAKVATSSELNAAFGTSDFQTVARRILTEGDAQTTSGERKASADAIQRQITEFVVRNFVDARSGLRIPATRVQSAMAKFNCDVKEDVVQQARRFVRAAQSRGDLQLRRKEIVHRASFPLYLKGQVMSLIEGLGCSVLSKSKDNDKFTIELGCLAGELDEVVKKLDRIKPQPSRGGDAKTRGKARRGGRKNRQDDDESNPSGTTTGKGRRVKGKARNGASLSSKEDAPSKQVESVEVHVGPSELCKSTTEGTFARTRANEPRAQANAQRQQQHRSAGMKNSEEDVLDKDDEDEDGEDDDDDDANKNPL